MLYSNHCLHVFRLVSVSEGKVQSQDMGILGCRPASDPQLMSYRIFLDSFLLPIKVGKGAALEALNTAIKAERQKLKRVFTEAGQPGDMFRYARPQAPSISVRSIWAYTHYGNCACCARLALIHHWFSNCDCHARVPACVIGQGRSMVS